ncbi:hypothetical protein HDU93_007878 [Gonapodya sp. JEL0774]|nr:hypothetical protein HDU93_007878 [Gonapodya sp. JEL0774]
MTRLETKLDILIQRLDAKASTAPVSAPSAAQTSGMVDTGKGTLTALGQIVQDMLRDPAVVYSAVNPNSVMDRYLSEKKFKRQTTDAYKRNQELSSFLGQRVPNDKSGLKNVILGLSEHDYSKHALTDWICKCLKLNRESITPELRARFALIISIQRHFGSEVDHGKTFWPELDAKLAPYIPANGATLAEIEDDSDEDEDGHNLARRIDAIVRSDEQQYTRTGPARRDPIKAKEPSLKRKASNSGSGSDTTSGAGGLGAEQSGAEGEEL